MRLDFVPLVTLALLLARIGLPAAQLAAAPARPSVVVFLADDPARAAQLTSLRAALDGWLKQQGDALKTFAKPRLLSDDTSYGAKAEINNDR